MENKELSFTLHFISKNDNDEEFPVSVITNTLTAFQRIIYLLGMEREKQPVHKKARINQSIESKYAVMCSAPQKGSLIIPTIIGNADSGLFDFNDIKEVVDKYKQVNLSFRNNNIDGIFQLLPDKSYRSRVLDNYRNMIPPKGSNIGLEISNGTGAILLNDSDIDKTLEDITVITTNEEEIRIVTGTLSKIDFTARAITLIYPETHKELKCYYDEGLEDLLLDNPREYIQVTGKVVLDEEGFPKEIREVESIRDMDLSPFYVKEIKLSDNRVLKYINQQLELTPFLDESKQLICLEKQELGIDVYSYTRDELDSFLKAQIDYLWRTFAEGDENNMTPLAIKLSESLKNSFQVVQ